MDLGRILRLIHYKNKSYNVKKKKKIAKQNQNIWTNEQTPKWAEF